MLTSVMQLMCNSTVRKCKNFSYNSDTFRGFSIFVRFKTLVFKLRRFYFQYYIYQWTLMKPLFRRNFYSGWYEQ